ncbi:acetyl-coenzyme A synthetase [Microbotryum lychnidis-dioicae p1A1 Lamole]|uniref:Acetyl-coenzyme A synthetase n=1 Tax=Microbotryum lychnidis-dioicae (strain p1A1 Lamole / MvSl-1064) TaxID=683840 RepID=U5GZ32_USTV1|nr:acetyl-coenzyme A synthetase [Microbotryum lychnidis-dioicae p1A1 Lamole]|eukprot:KDE09541.1 acetyl-coenzyme A synthetase [Microbotryum lychnidis-dioicae p1A1 Lamole]
MADQHDYRSAPTHEISKRTNGKLSEYKKPHADTAEYERMYKESIEQPSVFWDKMAKEHLYWHRPYSTVMAGSFEAGDVQWFPEGGLNVSYNCVDRWAYKNPDKTAIIWEADEPGEHVELTYSQLLQEVCRMANILKDMSVKKGDTVAIYLPMVPEAAIAFLACARLGAVHSVVFAGFSAESLRDRVQDAKSRVVITADEGKRGGKTIATKSIVDAALSECPDVEHVLVLKRTGGKVKWTEGRDVWWHEAKKTVQPYCSPEIVNSEDPLFILYTSGSTGKPKGVVHSSAGYLLGAFMTLKYVFDVHPDDKYACMADVGWITGHTYIVYGPLANGVTTTIFESTPVYPTPSRFWEVVAKHKLTQFYTAPTAIRLLRRLGEKHVEGHDLSTLRTIGSVGEPINPEAWEWYHEHVGKKECQVVDTYWQTETGSIIITPLPGATKTKPGSATLPFFGIKPVLLDPTTGKVITGNEKEGVLAVAQPWPSIARTVYGDHQRYLETYLKPYPGYYFTGDGAGRDHDGYYWIRGRVDDVINVSGHRLSTAEIESALIQHPGVAEAAVVGIPDEVTGQSIVAYVTMKPDFNMNDTNEASLSKELVLQVRKSIGPFSAPKHLILLGDLPKTRSGKIMRRILRKVAAGEGDQLGDLSTLAEPEVVETIKTKTASSLKK